MSVKLNWDGLADLKDALRRLPEELTSDGSGIVTSTGNEAEREIVSAYPSRTGNLKKGVRVSKVEGGRFGAGVTVKNTAKHANIFENGTQARHNALGANRGSMPPGHVFIPIMSRKRRQMYDELKQMLVEHGLKVSGNA